jgi:hypothetical protein
MKVLQQVGPQQVKLMLISEVMQLEEYYDDDLKVMPRNLAIAISLRKQSLDDDPVETGEVKKRIRSISRFVHHPHRTHTTHTAPHSTYCTMREMKKSSHWRRAALMATSSTTSSSNTLWWSGVR